MDVTLPIPTETSPRVSVCIPVYNGRNHLRAALASVLAQTYSNLELLVFDDASTDDSWAILSEQNDPRIQITRNERNLGPEGNWSRALASGTGKYLKLFHQDDLLAPDCLTREVAVLEACPRAVLAFCGRTIIRSDGRPILKRSPPWPEGELAAEAILRGCFRSGTNLIGEPSAVLIRADAARATGAFDGRIPYVIDLDYWVRLLDHGSAYCLKPSLASFRISPDQWSAAIGWQQGHQFAEFLDLLVSSGRWHMGKANRIRGKVMAFRNQMLRLLVYRLMAGPGR